MDSTAPVVVGEARFPWTRVSNVALLAAVAFAFLALRRYATYHNETFDLAFYTRIVWGLQRGDFFQPLTDSMFQGLHAFPILQIVFVRLARFFPIAPLLLVVQAFSVAAAGIPLARIAARRVGHSLAADVTLLAYLLYPTVATVATYEFHPSVVALFPLALALEYLDRRLIYRALAPLLVAALCREDVALTVGFMGLAFALRRGQPRAHTALGLAVFALGVGYFARYVFVVAPPFRPRFGAFNEHFGQLGASPGGVLRSLVFHPFGTFRALATPARLMYLPRLLVPVAFLSLLAPRWLLPAVVAFGINFISSFPAAVQVHSHYSVLIVPFVFAAAAHGTGRLVASAQDRGARHLAAAALAVACGTLYMQHRAGATPLSRRWDTRAFRRDHRAPELARLLALVPRDAMLAAPDYVLPHVAERGSFFRVPWIRLPDFGILATSYRARFAGSQDLWRSSEEAVVRNALASREFGVYAVEPHHVLFRHHWPARAYARGRYVEFQPTDGMHTAHADVGPSLALAAYGVEPTATGSVVTLFLLARTAWPPDLGLELGWGEMHPAGDREDPSHIVAALPFDGLFSPVHVRAGEVARTRIELGASPAELAAHGLYFGARRIDGSRLDAQSAHWTLIPGTRGAP